VRRGFIGEKYRSLVGALYEGRQGVHVEAQVKYEDGRTGTYSADLRIEDARTFAPAAAQRAA
jgi:long-chain acyl-CoA synthetase